MTPAFLAWQRGLPEPTAGARAPYRGHAATFARLAALVERGVEVDRIGDSVQGEPLWSFAIGPSAPRATTFVVAGLHAMEHVGVATAIALLEAAARAPWGDHRLVVVPLANPDGFRAVCASLASGRRRFHRANARGVDLNRNFAIGWGDDHYLTRWFPRLFDPGAAPLSEPESQAIDRALARARPTYAVSLHAFGRYIFLPYAGSRAAPRDLPRMIELARAMAARQARPYRVMQLGVRSRLFLARGAEIDHMYERHGALSFLYEIGAGPRLGHPSTWHVPYRWFTPPAALLERDVAEAVAGLTLLAEA